MRLRATRLSSVGSAGRARDPYGRVFLADAATGLLASGFTYTRSGPDLWCPQADGSLASFAANVIPREWANGRWGFRFDPGWNQSLPRTHELGNAAWLKNSIVQPVQDSVGPTGAADMWAMIEAPGTAYRNLEQATSFVAGQSYTITVYVTNRVGSRFVQLRFPGVAFGVASVGSFDPRTGSALSLNGAIVHTPVKVGNGWIFSATATATATVSGVIRVQLVASQAVADESYLGDGVSGVNVWGVNLTNTSYPVPLTVAQGTAVTVGNHSCSALLSALGISLGGEYSIGIDYTLANLTANYQPITVAVSDNTFNESIYQNAANLTAGREPNWAVIDGGVGQANGMGLGPSAVVGSLRKTALRARPNDFRSAFNGVLTQPDSLGTLPSVDRVYVGTNWQGTVSNALQGRVHKLWLAPSRALTDTELQAVTA